MSNLNFSLDDVDFLYDLKSKSSYFRSEETLARFNLVREKDRTFEMVISEPDFDEGSIFWFNSASSSMLVYKILESMGYESHLAYDNSLKGTPYVVLSEMPWDLNEPSDEDVNVYSIYIPCDSPEEINETREYFESLTKTESIDLVMDSSRMGESLMLRASGELRWGRLRELQAQISKDLGKDVGISEF